MSKPLPKEQRLTFWAYAVDQMEGHVNHDLCPVAHRMADRLMQLGVEMTMLAVQMKGGDFGGRYPATERAPIYTEYCDAILKRGKT